MSIINPSPFEADDFEKEIILTLTVSDVQLSNYSIIYFNSGFVV